ncbi:MAG: MFS transporter [Candidatus Nanohaloarchaea archaeon]
MGLVPAFLLVGVGLWRSVPGDLGNGGPDIPVIEGIRASLRCLRTRRIATAVGAIVVMLFVFQGLTAFFTTYLIEVRGLDPRVAGGLFALLFLSGAGFQLGAGRLADRFGYRRVMIGVSLVSVFPLVALPFTYGLVGLALLTVFIGIRLAIAPLTNAYIVGSLPADTQGTVWGFLRMGFFAVGSLGSVVVGRLGDLGLFDPAFFVLAAFTAVGAGFYWLVPER